MSREVPHADSPGLVRRARTTVATAVDPHAPQSRRVVAGVKTIVGGGLGLVAAGGGIDIATHLLGDNPGIAHNMVDLVPGAIALGATGGVANLLLTVGIGLYSDSERHAIDRTTRRVASGSIIVGGVSSIGAVAGSLAGLAGAMSGSAAHTTTVVAIGVASTAFGTAAGTRILGRTWGRREPRAPERADLTE